MVPLLIWGVRELHVQRLQDLVKCTGSICDAAARRKGVRRDKGCEGIRGVKGKGVEEGIVDRMEGKDRRKCGWKERKEKEKISFIILF